MLSTLKLFFDKYIAKSGADLEHRLQLATAVLMVEVMKQDDKILASEEEMVRKTVMEKFSLSDQETKSLFELIHAEATNTLDYFQFTRMINEHFSQEQKQRVIEFMWQIAIADGDLDLYEEIMIRKIADQLDITHSQVMQCKERAMEASQEQ